MSELRPPFAEPASHTSTYGRTFVVCSIVGSAFMGFGLLSLMSHAGATHPLDFAILFVGLAVVHDFIVAPAAIVTATGARKVAPRLARGLLAGVLMISAIVTSFAIPALFGWGRQSDNPSFLPRNYGVGLLVVLAIVWAVAAGMLANRGRRARRGRRS